jgi:hypothetical protein
MIYRGGARIGLFNATWPFATLRVTNEELSLKVFSKDYKFRKEEIRKLEIFHGWFSTGIKIIHSSACESHIVFWSFSAKEVLAAAAHAGYSTEK